MNAATRNIVEWLGVILTIVFVLWLYRVTLPPKVHRYRCIVTVNNEVICFQPDGSIFRPERRFDEFILEVKQ